MIHLPINARWAENATTVAGGREQRVPLNQLHLPLGLCLDNNNETLFIADYGHHRIVAWKQGGNNTGRLVAGGKRAGNGMDQLGGPTDVLIDKDTDSLIICCRWNRRVMQWSLRSGTTQGEIIINNIDCWGLAMDDKGNIYVTDTANHEVRQYGRGEETTGIVVAGGNGEGNRLNQLRWPHYVFVDGEGAVYVSEMWNHRVTKWVKGAAEGIIVAGGRGAGNDTMQLSAPQGVFVDAEGTVYVAEWGNNRVVRWYKGATKGTVIASGNGGEEGTNQFNIPTGLWFDRHGNLYVADYGNHRVQRFDIVRSI